MTLKELIRQNPEGMVARAYRFAEQAHKGQKRATGDPFFTHVVATAETLADWRLDEHTVVAGLLHDIVEDTETTIEEIRQNFCEDVAFLVDGVTKLGRIKYRGAAAQAENLRKLILAISQDLRVVFVKLADRLHNMRTISAIPPAKQKRVALETYEIYAPLAARLGMRGVSGELEDLAFPILYQEEYAWLAEHVPHRYGESRAYLEHVKPEVERILGEHGLKNFSIDFRAKRYASLYKKLIRYNMDLEKIYDLVAFRVILPTVEACYAALGAIHSYWPPLHGRIKDYIAMPKPNGYRSLHTTVIGPDSRILEFQLQTQEMHEENEKGVAAHWIYKQSPERPIGAFSGAVKRTIEEELRWVQQIRRWQETYGRAIEDPGEFLDAMKINFFKDRIFVFTPRGDVKDLPAGSTPIDFAYHIHSELGNTAVGAKVNNHFVPLDHELQSGDLVEILTQKGKKPSEDWLSFVKTATAYNHIREALRKHARQIRGGPTKTELKIVVEDRVGLLKDIAGVIARSHFNIRNLKVISPGSKFPTDKIEIATTDRPKVEKLILKLKTIKGVKEVSYRII